MFYRHAAFSQLPGGWHRTVKQTTNIFASDVRAQYYVLNKPIESCHIKLFYYFHFTCCIAEVSRKVNKNVMFLRIIL